MAHPLFLIVDTRNPRTSLFWHRHGLRIMAHVKTVAELKDLLRAGVDMWTHPIADAPADEELPGGDRTAYLSGILDELKACRELLSEAKK